MPETAAMERTLPIELRLCLTALPRRVRQVLEQLLVCPVCGTSAGLGLTSLPAPEAPCSPPAHEYDGVFDQLEASLAETLALLPRERQRASLAAAELLARDPATWDWFVRETPDLHSLVAADVMLDRAEEVLPPDPAGAEARARAALAILRVLGEQPGPAGTLALRSHCRAWGLIGQARALEQDWTGVELAFDLAGRLVSRELFGSDEEAELLRRHALALLAQERESDALALLARSAEIAGELGDGPSELAALYRQGVVCFSLGDLPRAAGHLAWALRRAEQDGRQQQASSLRHHLAWVLLADDRVAAARELLAGATVSEDPRQLPKLLHFLADITGLDAGVETLRVKLAESRRREAAFETATYALLLARQAVRDRRLEDLRQLAVYFAEASASSQLSARSREALARFAEALLHPEALTVAIVVEIAQSLSYAEDTGIPEDEATAH